MYVKLNMLMVSEYNQYCVVMSWINDKSRNSGKHEKVNERVGLNSEGVFPVMTMI